MYQSFFSFLFFSFPSFSPAEHCFPSVGGRAGGGEGGEGGTFKLCRSIRIKQSRARKEIKNKIRRERLFVGSSFVETRRDEKKNGKERLEKGMKKEIGGAEIRRMLIFRDRSLSVFKAISGGSRSLGEISVAVARHPGRRDLTPLVNRACPHLGIRTLTRRLKPRR